MSDNIKPNIDTIEDKKIIQFLTENNSTINFSTIECSFISNKDKSIRWLYPKDMKRPMFLNFYNTASFRATVIKNIIKMAFFLKLSRFAKSGDLTVKVAEGSHLDRLLKKYSNAGFSIFTGTAGENRKVIIEIHGNSDVLVFVKLALEDSSKTLVINEAKKLPLVNNLKCNNLVVPKVLDMSEQGIIELSNIKPKKHYQSFKLDKPHFIILSQLYDKTRATKTWRELPALKEVRQKIDYLRTDYDQINGLDKTRIQQICNNILLLIQALDNDNNLLPVAIAHGDFTPWNMYGSDASLYLLDWELSREEMPVMFDIFHFVFQSETLIRYVGYAKIFAEIDKILKDKIVKNIVIDFKVDVNKHYIFYLVYTISYYLDKYVRQENLHAQAFWLLNNWEEAVRNILSKNGVVFLE